MKAEVIDTRSHPWKRTKAEVNSSPEDFAATIAAQFGDASPQQGTGPTIGTHRVTLLKNSKIVGLIVFER